MSKHQMSSLVRSLLTILGITNPAEAKIGRQLNRPSPNFQLAQKWAAQLWAHPVYFVESEARLPLSITREVFDEFKRLGARCDQTEQILG